MTEAEARELICERFNAQWPVESDEAPFMLDNERALSGDVFASLSIRFTMGAGQLTAGPAGTRLWERRGVIYVRIWTPEDEGAGGGSALCDAARRVFEGESLYLPAGGEPVTIEAGDTQPGMTDGRWWMSTVVFRFRYYETR
jgi:hypothetical protein